MSKRITAQPPYTLLVANLTGGSDPSRGRNPVKARTGFEYQHLPVVSRAAPHSQTSDGDSIGKTHQAHLGYTTPPVPVGASATIVVINTSFATGTLLYIGDYTLEADVDFDVSTGTTYTNEDITNTAPNSALTLFDTAGPNLINVPANLPIEPGSVTINWISGATGYSQTDDGLGGFTGDGTPGSSSINYTTGAITLDTAALPPDTGTSITITYTAVITADDIATSLAAAIDALPEFSAPAPGASTITITGPAGPTGNDLRLEAYYTGAAANFTLTPDDGTFAGAEPFIGPPIILP